MEPTTEITMLTSSGIIFAVILLVSIADYIDKQNSMRRPSLSTGQVSEHMSLEISPRSQHLRKARSTNNIMSV